MHLWEYSLKLHSLSTISLNNSFPAIFRLGRGSEMRSAKLIREERQVCRRLRDSRMKIGLSQSAIARKLGIPRDRLASYEQLRAPLKWGYGFLFCLEFGISLEWL